MAEVQDSKGTKHEDKQPHSVKKDVAGDKKESESKEEDGEKSKRSASHLISFFSQSKSSKNKDKEKEHTKEKEKSKSKDKDKGSSTPLAGKHASEGKSTLGGKLERKGSTGSTASQKSEGKSWRKSLGILGGGSKHDKEEKHKKSTDHRASTPSDMSAKKSPALSHKEESNAVKESKDEKSNRKQPERRNSTPTTELLKKNAKTAPPAQDSSALKTVIENKEEKASKKQPERRGSTPTTDSQTAKNAHGSSNKQDESSLKTLKEETKAEILTKEQSARQSSVEPQTKSSHPGSSKPEEPSSQKTVKTEGKISNKTGPNSHTRTTNDNGSSISENTVQLREKKGRVIGDERREKAKSLGDISSKLHTVEVSILDPTVPPSRTVDTMDIPDQLTRHAKRPMSSNAVLETPPLATKNKRLERKSQDAKDDHGVITIKDQNGVRSDSDTLKNSSSTAERVVNENSSEHKETLDTKSVPSSEGSDNEGALAPGHGTEKKVSDQISKVVSSAKTSRSESGSSFMSDISELSAELSAAIASPPPQPIRLSMSESNLLSSGPPLSNRRSPIGKDQGMR